jgi:hypothetical protein
VHHGWGLGAARPGEVEADNTVVIGQELQAIVLDGVSVLIAAPLRGADARGVFLWASAPGPGRRAPSDPGTLI